MGMVSVGDGESVPEMVSGEAAQHCECATITGHCGGKRLKDQIKCCVYFTTIKVFILNSFIL